MEQPESPSQRYARLYGLEASARAVQAAYASWREWLTSVATGTEPLAASPDVISTAAGPLVTTLFMVPGDNGPEGKIVFSVPLAFNPGGGSVPIYALIIREDGTILLGSRTWATDRRNMWSLQEMRGLGFDLLEAQLAENVGQLRAAPSTGVRVTPE